MNYKDMFSFENVCNILNNETEKIYGVRPYKENENQTADHDCKLDNDGTGHCDNAIHGHIEESPEDWRIKEDDLVK